MKTTGANDNRSLDDILSISNLAAEIEESSSSIVVVRLRRESTPDPDDDLACLLNSPVVLGARFVILEVRGLRAVSDAELQALVDFRRTVCRRGGEVRLAGVRPAVWLALHLAQLEKLFPIWDSVAQALAS
jgi:anti-anti-sigma regulatory factor